MIVPMKKITLVVLDREREIALDALRKTGVLHVEKRDAPSKSLADLQNQVARLDQACAILSDIKTDKKTMTPKVLGRDQTLDLVDRIFSARDERRTAQETIAQVNRELDRLRNWGDVDPAGFEYLAKKGIHLIPFEFSVQDFSSLPETVRTIMIEHGKKTVRCVIVCDTPNVATALPSGSKELSLPVKSTGELKSDRLAAERLIPVCNSRLAADALFAESIYALKTVLTAEIEFETVRSGMPLIALGDESIHLESTSLAWLTGYIPTDKQSVLVAAVKKHGWAVMMEDPSDDDNVPTQLRNNRFVNLISPLLEFLGTVPGYRELDISLWFLLFFGIFFAMIFGDGGYGSLLVVIATVSILSSVRKKKPVATGLYMMLYLSLMTVAWGAATCSWFGLPLERLPSWLKSMALPAFSSENPQSATNIKIFCFVLGLVQLSLAHVIGMIRNVKTLKVLGELGSLLMTVGMFFVVLNLVIDAEKYPLTDIVLGMVGAGFALNFIFINYSGSVGGSILESFKNIITMFLGVVNVFGDIMSYIRLWAVGLAGAAISSTVNSMAGDFMGGFIIFAGLILLLFGHGLNLMMNILSVVVHGVRLNTLEFSNHLGLTWSGFKYEPFSETVKK